MASGDLLSAAGLISLLTLIALEVVLGIDNVIFIAILAGRLPADEQPKARRLGIAMAVVTRIAAAAQHRVGDAADRAALHDRQLGAVRARR